MHRQATVSALSGLGREEGWVWWGSNEVGGKSSGAWGNIGG